jgi:hypothetical protein
LEAHRAEERATRETTAPNLWLRAKTHARRILSAEWVFLIEEIRMLAAFAGQMIGTEACQLLGLRSGESQTNFCAKDRAQAIHS